MFKIRAKILGSVLLLVVILVGGILTLISARLKSADRQSLNESLSKSLSVVQRFFDEKASGLENRAHLAADTPGLREALQTLGPVWVPLDGTGRDLREKSGADLLIITDSSGRIRYDSRQTSGVTPLPTPQGSPTHPSSPLPNAVASAASWPCIQKALAGETSRGVFTVPREGEASSSGTYQLSTVPFRFSDGGPVAGALLLGLPLDQNLAVDLQQMTGCSVAFNLGGKILAASWKIGLNPSFEEALAPVAGQAETWLQERGTAKPFPARVGDEEYAAIFYPFRDPRGLKTGDIILLQSLDAAKGLQESVRRSVIGLGLGGIVLALFLGWLLSRHLTKPLALLSLTAEKAAQGDFTPPPTSNSRDELGSLSRTFHGMVANLRDKERVTHILGKSVPPDVARRILSSEEGLALKGERRECAILFAGLKGFRATSEHLSPEALVGELNEFFGRMADVVHDHQGTLDKFAGDSLQAVWGAPVPFEDKELRAAKCALGLRSALDSLNQKRASRGASPLQLGIGLNSGIVISGNLGSERRVDYTVIGSEVGVAQSLCERSVPGEILATDAFLRKCRGLLKAEPRPPFPAEGSSTPLAVHAVIGLAS